MSECDDLKKCREAVSDRLTNIETAIEEIRDSYVELNTSLDKNSKELAELKELLTVWKNGKGFITTAGLIGKLVVWASLVGGAVTAMYKYLSHLGQP